MLGIHLGLKMAAATATPTVVEKAWMLENMMVVMMELQMANLKALVLVDWMALR